MAIYVNINDGSQPGVVEYTGTGHAGTTEDPWSFADLLANYATEATSARFLIKGWRIGAPSFNVTASSASPHIWDMWGTEPWRLVFDGVASFSDVGADIRGGYMAMPDHSRQIGCLRVENMYVVHNNVDSFDLVDSVNCAHISTILGPQSISYIGGVGSLFDKCLFSRTPGGPPWDIYSPEGGTTNVQNNAVTAANIGALVSAGSDLGGNLYSQSAPTRLSWNQPIAAYNQVPGYGVGAVGGWAESNAPTANFSGTPLSGTEPLSVTFTDSSTETPTSWDWNFGDGTAHATTQNPVHVYASEGTYTVTLVATNGTGSSAPEVKTGYITVSDDIPVASFSGTPLSGDEPLTVVFTDSSTNNPSSWAWNFGDYKTSTSQNPSHQYAKRGKYTVTLIATNAAGPSAAVSRIEYVDVLAPYQPPRDQRPGSNVIEPQTFEDLRSGNNSQSVAGSSETNKISTSKSGIVLGEIKSYSV